MKPVERDIAWAEEEPIHFRADYLSLVNRPHEQSESTDFCLGRFHWKQLYVLYPFQGLYLPLKCYGITFFLC